MAGPFLLFLAATAAAGAIVYAGAHIAAARGRARQAGSILVVGGVVFFLTGVLLFAPQPLWVGAALIGLGIARLVKAPRNEHRRSA